MNKLYYKSIQYLKATLGSIQDNVLITSGASESNMTVLNTFRKIYPNGHIVVTQDNHPSLFEMLKYLNMIYTVCDYGSIKNAINDNTVLICYPMVAPLTGEINNTPPKNDIAILCDATQAVGKLHVTRGRIDYMTFSGHKFGAPVGIGGIIYSKDAQLLPLIPGSQQGGLRGGTINVVGLNNMCNMLQKSLASRLDYGYTAKTLITGLHDQLKDHNILPINSLKNNIGTTLLYEVPIGLPEKLVERGFDIGVGCACQTDSESTQLRISIGLDFDESLEELGESIIELYT